MIRTHGYTADNSTATYMLKNASGCDSVVTLNLTINQSNTGTDTQVACDSYTWINGTTYTASNTSATHTVKNASGCDSVVTLNLTINQSNTGTDTQIACDSFTWIDSTTYTTSNSTATYTLKNVFGCDSVVTLNLTINSANTGTDVQFGCDSFTWINGITYLESNNTATHTVKNALGCDSLVTLNLTLVSLDMTVVANDSVLTSNAVGVMYQWLDCRNNYAQVPGARAGVFTPTSNGSYAVQITQTPCVDTSECFTISNSGINLNAIFSHVLIYPNPTDGIVNINLGDLTHVNIDVYDLNGRIQYQRENLTTATHQFKLDVAPGVYIIELHTQGLKQRYKLVIR